jgi:phosphoserine phosphatase
MKLIFLDMDGVLTPKAHALHLAEMVDKTDELKKIFTGTTNKKIGLEWVVRKGSQIFAGIDASFLQKAGETLPMVKGAEKTVKELKKGGYEPILITNGIVQIACAFAEKVGINKYYGNTLEIKDGKITGNLDTSTLITLQSKGDVVRKVVSDTQAEKSVAVGNDENDWAMFQEVDFSILFNPSSNLINRLEKCLKEAEKGFKKEFIEFSRSVDVIIEEPNFELILPFVIPEPTVFPDKVRIEKTKFV